MGVLVDYFIYGTIAVICGYLAFKLWDRLESNKGARAIRNPDWLHPRDSTPAQATFGRQEIYDFSNAFIGTLRGALAVPTPARLERLSTTLAAPQTQDTQLWQDMALRLSQTAASYPVEFLALVETLTEHAADDIQRGTARHLARHTSAKSGNVGTVIGKMLPWRL